MTLKYRIVLFVLEVLQYLKIVEVTNVKPEAVLSRGINVTKASDLSGAMGYVIETVSIIEYLVGKKRVFKYIVHDTDNNTFHMVSNIGKHLARTNRVSLTTFLSNMNESNWYRKYDTGFLAIPHMFEVPGKFGSYNKPSVLRDSLVDKLKVIKLDEDISVGVIPATDVIDGSSRLVLVSISDLPENFRDEEKISMALAKHITRTLLPNEVL